jgi:septal ring factor EnvC (AmiA/AmiB activator)
MIRARFLLGPAFMALAIAGDGAFSARAADPEKSNTQLPVAQLKKVESTLDEKQNRATLLAEKEKEAAADLADLRQKLIAATEALQQKENEQSKLEDRLHDLEHDVSIRSAELAKTKSHLAVLTTALLRFGEEPSALMLMPAALTDDQIHRAILLRALLPRLEEQAEAAARDLKALDELRQKATEQRHLVVAARQNLEDQQLNLDQLIATRQGLMQKTEAEKAAIARQLVSLTSEARDLRELMAKLAPERKSLAGPALPPSLTRPVAGTLLRGFGSKDADGVESQGLTFAGLPGGPVVAPASGRVVFAGPFRGYGQILILQHKGGYHSFLAGFGRIDAEMGQDVVAGEPLGILPTSEEKRPELYFEWRRNGEPVDPMEGSARHASDRQ